MVEKMRIGIALQPVATALFANSPFRDGSDTGKQRSHNIPHLSAKGSTRKAFDFVGVRGACLHLQEENVTCILPTLLVFRGNFPGLALGLCELAEPYILACKIRYCALQAM